MRDRPLSALLIAPDRPIAEGLSPGTGRSRPFQILADVSAYPSDQLLEMRLRQLHPQVVLIDLATDIERACALVGQAASRGYKVAGLHRDNAPDAVVRSVRAGAVEFLHMPFAEQSLIDAARRLRSMLGGDTGRSSARGRVAAFAGAKGGCGTSMLAAQTAFALGAMVPGRVLAADLDPMDATLSFALRLARGDHRQAGAPDASLKHWRESIQALDAIHAMRPPGVSAGDAVSPVALSEFLEEARREYEWVVLDLPPIFHRLSLLALSDSDAAFLVAAPDLPSLHLARKATALLTQVGFGTERYRVLVNRVPPDDALGVPDMSRMVNAPVARQFPQEYHALEEALIDGAALAADSPLGKAIAEFARGLAQTRAAEEARAVPAATAAGAR